MHDPERRLGASPNGRREGRRLTSAGSSSSIRVFDGAEEVCDLLCSLLFRLLRLWCRLESLLRRLSRRLVDTVSEG